MADDHAGIRARLFAFEELDADERRVVEHHIAACESCRALWAGLREREAAARPEGRLPVDALPLAGADEDAERASADRLVARLAVGPRDLEPEPAPEPRPVPRRRMRPAVWWLVPAAAAAALAVLVWPTPRRAPEPAPGVFDVRVLKPSALRGSQSPAFRTGDAFEVRLRLSRPAIPIVVVLDDAGRPDVLFPPARGPAAWRAAGEVALPDPASGERWILTGPPGRETFFTCASADPEFDPDALGRALAEHATPGIRRARVAAAVRAELERRAGAVSEVTIHHLP